VLLNVASQHDNLPFGFCLYRVQNGTHMGHVCRMATIFVLHFKYLSAKLHDQGI
jgi:hypothetical protein